MKQIANRISDGGKVLTSEARQVANAYLSALEKIAVLEKQIETLGGGASVTLYSWKEEGRHPKHFDALHSRVWDFVRADKTHSASGREISQLNDLLRFGIVEGGHMGLNYTSISAPEHHAKRFLEINRIVTELIQNGYNEGFNDGKSLLRGLANGSVSMSDFSVFESNVKDAQARLPREN